MNTKTVLFRSLSALAVMLLIAGMHAHGQVPMPGSLRFAPDAAWGSSDIQVDELRARCWASNETVARAGVPAAMQDLGAPPKAVAWASHRGDGSYLRMMDTSGIVDIAIVHYPLRAQDAHELLFLMPDGEVLNVDDAHPYPRADLLRDGEYVSLQKRHPDLSFHPADRSPNSLPRIESLPGNRARVIVEYRLTDGCRACARAGYARGAFYFDAEGRFLAKKFLGVYSTPPARPEGTAADCDTPDD